MQSLFIQFDRINKVINLLQDKITIMRQEILIAKKLFILMIFYDYIAINFLNNFYVFFEISYFFYFIK